MKKIITTSILFLLISGGINIKAQPNNEEYLGLPGDNLNLYAVMDLFRESKTLEEFERNLNAEDNKINNLDLNGDNFVDYIMVSDYPDGDDHTIVLSVAINKNEKQDVAVFTVNRFNNGSVQIQLIGDEELYGKNYIIEPIYDSGETPNPGYKGNPQNVQVVRTNVYEVAAWPMMMYIYQPTYVVWRSGWYYGYYPSYWHPWNPFYYHYYYGYHSHWYPEYYKHYRHWNQPRYQHYNTFYYTSVRSHSVQVDNRIREGNYRTTYSHPETRSEGEKKGRTYNPAPDRRSDNTKADNKARSFSEMKENNSRRSTNTVKEKSVSDREQTGRENRSRSSNNANEKSVTTTGKSGREESTGKSTTTTTGKSTSRHSTENKSATERRPEKSSATVKPEKSGSSKSTKTESAPRKSENKSETPPPARKK
jgi:hypothetical protein